MSDENDNDLAKVLTDDVKKRRELPGFADIDWGGLSDSEFGRKRAQVFRETKLVHSQEGISGKIEEIDRLNRARLASEQE